ncbi:hypothetical protein [Bacillus velezensis]|uniref:hypothetical protein n=1 Tax=Bacillus velezensis TaxID=492670 RepID=UPI0013D8C19D|nr:hypothetical protein [Bacillus velezensis]
MNLEFENWIHSQSFTDESLDLIDEAIRCYRIGAYRASFILSYSFFLKILKNRLETCASQQFKPDLVDERTWRNIIMKLNNDDIWENVVFETTQASEKESKRSKYYLISDGLRDDMRYWRRRRNDCAHAKNSVIGNSIVESFWHFIQSHLSKFVINGGREGLLNKIKTHFDPNYTEPGKSASFLIEQIPLVVESFSEIPFFLQEIYSMLKNEITIGFKLKNEESPLRNFWKEIAFSNNEKLRIGFLNFIKNDWEVFTEFISAFPSKINEFTTDEVFIRNFWKEQFFEYKYNYTKNFWEIALFLVKNVIPEGEKDSFVGKLVNKAPRRYINEHNLRDIKQIGYFTKMKKSLFGTGKFGPPNGYTNANYLSGKIIFYLKHGDLDAEIVRELNSLVSGITFGSFYNDFKDFLENNNNIFLAFKQIAESEEINLTEFFDEFIEKNSISNNDEIED